MDGGVLFTVISAVVIPFLVTLLKKIKLPTKFAPIAALVLAVVIVAGAKVLGFDLDTKTIMDAILQAVGIAGASVLGYDVVKKLTPTK